MGAGRSKPVSAFFAATPGRIGPYQLQALIAACHADRSGPDTDWARIRS
jgi:predicted RNA polymerase sigma factor